VQCQNDIFSITLKQACSEIFPGSGWDEEIVIILQLNIPLPALV
jgi:hypothetical protein